MIATAPEERSGAASSSLSSSELLTLRSRRSTGRRLLFCFVAEPQLLLSRHPSVRTFDLDEARTIYARRNTSIRTEVLDRRTPFSWRGNAYKVGPILIGANAYGAGVHSRSDAPMDGYSATFALGSVGGEGFDGRGAVTVAKDRTAWLASPVGASSFRHGTHYLGLNIVIPRAAMAEALFTLSGNPNREVLRFDPTVSLGLGSGAALQRMIRFVAEEVNHDAHAFSSPLVAARFVDSLLLSMLLGQPNNFSSMLQHEPLGAGPRHVREAADYLAAHAGEPIRIQHLTKLTGVSARTLQAGFIKRYGRSPMEFLRDRRLELARAKLTMPSSASVKQIAHECGFAHLGRFSAEYRARFDETPSATRAKAR